MPRSKGAANRDPTGSIFEDSIAKKPPQCRAMTCAKDYRSSKCCFFCHKKYACSWPCLNHPLDCGLLVVPRRKKRGESNETD